MQIRTLKNLIIILLIWRYIKHLKNCKYNFVRYHALTRANGVATRRDVKHKEGECSQFSNISCDDSNSPSPSDWNSWTVNYIGYPPALI